VFALPILSTNAFAMFKVCLFSPVKGKVVNKGQLVVGAVIERSYDWAWKDQKGHDQTETDQNGEFSLPAIYGTMILGSVLPHEPVIEQDIIINHEGTAYKAWHCYKREYDEFGELRGVLKQCPITLYCDLQSTFRRFEIGSGYSGIGELK
jgi:hypothetical protein